MNDVPKDNRFLDRLGACWVWLGGLMRHRPFTVLGIIIATAIFFGVAVWVYDQAADAQKETQQIQEAFCNGQAPPSAQITKNCRALLDQLLRDPTPEQAKRLRELVQQAGP